MKTGTALLGLQLLMGCTRDAMPPAAEESSTASDQARDTTGVLEPAGMAGMDHGGMAGMQGDSQAPAGAGMPAMNHAEMPGMSGSGATGGAAAMDHGNMPGMSAGGASAGRAELDHGGMAGHVPNSEASQGTSTVGATGMAGMQGMDHSQMQAAPVDMSPTSASTGRAPMDHATTALPGQTRTMPGVDHAAMPPDPDDGGSVLSRDPGMEKLRALVAELVQDPGVQAQIQADTALRRRWADEGVRRVLLNP